MRAKWLWLSSACVLVLAAAGALILLHHTRAAPRILLVRPARPVLPPEISLVGKVHARHIVSVAAPVQGVIETFFVEVGQDVAQGQELVRIASIDLDGARDAAAAELARAQAKSNSLESGVIAARLEASRSSAVATTARANAGRFEKIFLRQQMLYREGATPRLVFERAEADYARAKADLQTAEQVNDRARERAASLGLDLDNARSILAEKDGTLEQARATAAAGEVRAPVDGLVVGRYGDAGTEVTPALSDLVEIAVDLSLLEVLADVPLPVAERLPPGTPALVRVAELGSDPIPGAVKDIRNGQIVVEFISPSPALKPGLTAQVTIRLP